MIFKALDWIYGLPILAWICFFLCCALGCQHLVIIALRRDKRKLEGIKKIALDHFGRIENEQ